jgi:hypothetical protein
VEVNELEDDVEIIEEISSESVEGLEEDVR